MRASASGLVDSARSGDALPAVQHDPADGNVTRLKHQHGHHDVIQRAEARAADDHRIEIAFLGEIEDRVAGRKGVGSTPSHVNGTITPPAPSITSV